ncbi:MAG: alpha/beta hydrolase, partial [Syntrophales bacterium LBB04]|nr:alpha/beta hydrolase [Syntrophales bacterium LBB04]
GTDFALFLAKYGITSMVLKYRTYNTNGEDLPLKYDEYIYHVYADAKQAIYLFRSQAKELGLDAAKIGIAGFSAGGSLALGTALEIGDDKLPAYTEHTKPNTRPDFACLVYPGIHPDFIKAAEVKANIPPLFIINGGEDTVTPAKNGIDLFSALHKRNIRAEIHIYAKGGHGFDSGVERGNGISTWRDNFIAWLKDMEILKN